MNNTELRNHCNELYDNSIKLMELIGQSFEKDEILISLMSQFTPTKNCEGIKELCRKTTTFEYNSVIKAIEKYGFEGYIQQKSSAEDVYIPQFFNDKKVTFFQNDWQAAIIDV